MGQTIIFMEESFERILSIQKIYNFNLRTLCHEMYTSTLQSMHRTTPDSRERNLRINYLFIKVILNLNQIFLFIYNFKIKKIPAILSKLQALNQTNEPSKYSFIELSLTDLSYFPSLIE